MVALSKPKLPLEGLRVLDLTRLYPGPLAAMWLAENGADVIKVEDPNRPDPMRFYPPLVDGVSAGFLAVNASKRNLALSLEKPDDKALFFDLVKQSDVVLESFRPGVAKRLGIDHETLQQYNPRIILASLSAHGQSGPDASLPGHDLNFQARSGLLAASAVQGDDPPLPGAQHADIAGGAYQLYAAVLTALVGRALHGGGCWVDAAMLDGSLPLLSLQYAHLGAGALSAPGQGMLDGGLACYGVYRCKDGRHVALAALEPQFWRDFCQAVGHPEWESRHYSAGDSPASLEAELTRLFLQKPRDEWLQLPRSGTFCLSPVRKPDEVVKDPHLRARGAWIDGQAGSRPAVPWLFDDHRPGQKWAARPLGADNEEVMAEIKRAPR